MLKHFRFFGSLIALAWLAVPAILYSAPLQKKVFIIGVDGTMTQYLAVARTPNLNALKAGGAFTDRAVNAPVTHSAACWASMFTGVWGDKSLITNANNALSPNRFDLYPSFMRRLEMANSNLQTVAYLRWCPLQDAIAGTDVITCYGSDAAITTATCNLLTNGNPDVFYTILLDVDSAGHSPGWGTPAYISAIETADGRIGQMMNALTNRATYANEDWLVIILADHGEHDSTVERSRMTFHLVWGSKATRGTIYPTPSIVDVYATVLAHMGVPVDPAWNLDARVEGVAGPPIQYKTNLIFNGDAEYNSGTNNYQPDRGIAWWWDFSGTTLAVYGSRSNFLASTNSGPSNRGNNYFLGGTNRNTFISQTINISDFATDIDDGRVDYQLAGWLGGAGTASNSTLFSVRFLTLSNILLGSNYIGPVTTTDRGGVSGLLERSTNGTLPAGTRLAEFTLTMSSVNLSNDAAADNLSFLLTPRYRLQVAAQGNGGVTAAPAKETYPDGESVVLTATPGGCDSGFVGWADGAMENPRTIVIGASNSYAAIFDVMEGYGGRPVLSVNGETNHVFVVTNEAMVCLGTSFTKGSIRYTVDGSAPGLDAILYTNCFSIGFEGQAPGVRTVTIRAVAYDGEGTASPESCPGLITIVPGCVGSYRLFAQSAGGGEVRPELLLAEYPCGTMVSNVAVAAPGWRFLGWLGDAAGTDSVARVSLTEEKCVEAVFGAALSLPAMTGGSIWVEPPAELYPYGTKIKLTALPENGNYFGGWGGLIDSTNNPLILEWTNAAATVSAAFLALAGDRFSLTVLTHGKGRVTREPEASFYPGGTLVTNIAVPDPGQMFLGWSGDTNGSIVEGTSLVLLLETNKVIEAEFTSGPFLEILKCNGRIKGPDFPLLVIGDPGERYSIEGAMPLPGNGTNQSGWQSLGIITNNLGRAQFADPPTNAAGRFYRAVTVP